MKERREQAGSAFLESEDGVRVAESEEQGD